MCFSCLWREADKKFPLLNLWGGKGGICLYVYFVQTPLILLAVITFQRQYNFNATKMFQLVLLNQSFLLLFTHTTQQNLLHQK